MPTVAAYGLSGDPITNGHRWVVEHGSNNYDKLFLIMASNADKRYAFQPLDRMTMCGELAGEFKNVELVVLSDNFLVRKAKELKATVLLRGIRNNMDREYEEGIRLFNRWLDPDIDTVYVQPPGAQERCMFGDMRKVPENEQIIQFVSSSLVRGIVGLKGWREVAAKLVPPYVMPYLDALSKKITEGS